MAKAKKKKKDNTAKYDHLKKTHDHAAHVKASRPQLSDKAAKVIAATPDLPDEVMLQTQHMKKDLFKVIVVVLFILAGYAGAYYALQNVDVTALLNFSG